MVAGEIGAALWSSDLETCSIHRSSADTRAFFTSEMFNVWLNHGWFGSRVVSVLDSGAVGSRLESQPRRCRVIVLGKLFTPIVPLFTNQRSW